ncbi:hypothetical protein FRC11_011393 [Ceratobasidium sp. 423]|nr:hypothetical protein FRC11_011393 [Ceratobasidium sp. 423]
MSHPLLWPTAKVFQPLGETAALCLTQDLAPEQSADILLLGCGDPRYILFTLFADAVTPNTRNILLFTLLEDKEHVDRVWDIFYHFKIDNQALSIITTQSQRLYDYAEHIYKWAESPYAAFIRITDVHSLAKLRKYWKSYKDFSGLPSKRLNALLDQQTRLSQSVLEKMEFSGNASLMAGMLWSDALPPVKALFKRYWETGTILTQDSDIQAAKNFNPLFIYSSAGETFNLHPATFPQGFHLASAMTSTIPRTKNAPTLGTEGAIIDTMKRQSESWAEALRVSRARSKITLRFFAGDALALCRTLNTWRTTLNSVTGVFSSEWHPGQLTFYDAVPLVFDVIETSSLTNNLDILNLLIAARPLLKDDPASQSILYTEERMSAAESDEHTPPLNRLGTTIPTMATLLGLAPRVYLSDVATFCDIHQTMSSQHVKRFRERIAWVNPAGGDRNARQHKLSMSFDTDDLVQIVYGIHHDMFAPEITKIAVVTGRQLPYEPPFHYTRETFAMLLRLIRRRVHLKNGTWDTFGAKLLELIEHDWVPIVGRAYWLDTCLQLHLAGIHTVHSLQPLTDPNDMPPVVCITLTVPRQRLQVLFDYKEKNCTPVLEVHLKLANTGGLAYSSIHAIWGKRRQTPNKILLEADEKGFDGNSDLVVIFWANSRLLGFEGATLSLSLKCTPHSGYLFRDKLGVSGNDLDLFSAATDDRRYVGISNYRPHLKDEPTLAPEDLIDFFSPEFKPMDDTTLITANVGSGPTSRVVVSLTARIEINTPAEQGALLEGAQVKASQVSPCAMKLEVDEYEHIVAYPYPIQGEEYKLRIARKSHYVEVIVPFSKPLDNAGYYLDKTPVLRNPNPSPWNVPHINGDCMPMLDIEDPKKLDWVKTLNNLQHSARERHVLNRHDPTELGIPINHWVNTKNTIRSLIMYASGIDDNPKNRVFSLSQSGTIYAFLLIGGVRLDLANFTVFLDAALIPTRTPQPSGQICQIKTSAVEALSWKKLFPVFAERCRTWSHNGNCEYAAQGEIPLSTELRQNPICSCGQGVGFNGSEWNVWSWKDILPYATRVAICGLYGVTCSESQPPQQSGDGVGYVPPQRRTNKACWTLHGSKSQVSAINPSARDDPQSGFEKTFGSKRLIVTALYQIHATPEELPNLTTVQENLHSLEKIFLVEDYWLEPKQINRDIVHVLVVGDVMLAYAPATARGMKQSNVLDDPLGDPVGRLGQSRIEYRNSLTESSAAAAKPDHFAEQQGGKGYILNGRPWEHTGPHYNIVDHFILKTNTQRPKAPEHSSEEDKPEDECEPSKKRSRQDKRSQSPESSNPDSKVKKVIGSKKAAFKSVPKPTADKSHVSKTSEELETAPPSELIVRQDGSQVVKVTRMKLHVPTGRVTCSNKNKS